jgi:hypothetical protein
VQSTPLDVQHSRGLKVCACLLLLLLLLQGGGFCGARTKGLNLDLSAYDGLQLRVKGDGQIFKFNIKTVRPHLDPATVGSLETKQF